MFLNKSRTNVGGYYQLFYYVTHKYTYDHRIVVVQRCVRCERRLIYKELASVARARSVTKALARFTIKATVRVFRDSLQLCMGSQVAD